MLINSEVPKSKFDPIYNYSSIDFSGESFLLHPDILVFNSYKYSNRDLAIYLALASLRSYAAYKVFGTVTLPLLHSPVHPHEYLNNTRLLPVDENDLIHFLYEEVTKETH